MICIVIASLYLLIDFILFYATSLIIKKEYDSSDSVNVSVIIAARNEAENLEKHLPLILKQNYFNFEVIVVDDQSIDNTEEIVLKMISNYSHLKYFKINQNIKSSKKHALTKGIEIAKYDHLIFTDADCKPLSDNWLKTFQIYFNNQNSIVLGYSPYKQIDSRLNRIIRFETYQTALNYFGFAKLGLAYMGVGRNLGYTKSVFAHSNGFQAHQNMLSGDDDLLVNQVAGQFIISCCLEPESFVESKPKTTFKSWIDQKRRHYTTAPKYKLFHQLLLGFQFLVKFLFCFLVFPICLFSLINQDYLPSIFLFSGLIFKLFFSKSLFKKFMVKDLWLYSFVLEIQLICLQLYIFSLNLVSTRKKW